MKVISIFTGKGGAGKTSISILLMSCLCYNWKQKVYALDFESPESRLYNKRKTDLNILKLGDSALSKLSDGNDFYTVMPVKRSPEGYSPKQLNEIAESLKKAKAAGEGYIICDFPGRFEKREAVYYLASRGLIDLFVFPIEPEDQSITSMLVVNEILNRKDFFVGMPEGHKQQVMCFWNKVTRNDLKNKMEIIPQYERMFETMGIPVSKTRINMVDTIKRTASAPVFVTTTVCYPRMNILKAFPPRPGEDRPYIENLFQEIKDRADATTAM